MPYILLAQSHIALLLCLHISHYSESMFMMLCNLVCHCRPGNCYAKQKKHNFEPWSYHQGSWQKTFAACKSNSGVNNDHRYLMLILFNGCMWIIIHNWNSHDGIYTGAYYIVITRVRGIWLKYTHDSRGRAAPKGECVYFSLIPSKRVITVMFHTMEVESIVSIIVKLWST